MTTLSRFEVALKFAAFLCFALLSTVVPARAQESDASPTEQQLYLQQADAAVREGRLTQAGQMIAWLESNGDKVSRDDIFLLKAEHAIAHQDVAAAASAIAAIKDDARNICRGGAARGWVSANTNQVDDAITAFASAVRNCPEDAAIWNLLGLAFVAKGEAEAASEAFERALILAPNSPDILNNHALALVQKGQLEIAFQQLHQAVNLAQQNPMIRANRDFVSGMLGHAPTRAASDSDAVWSARLVNVGKGAKAASRTPQANALFARALLTLDTFDEQVWSEINPSQKGPP